MKCLVITFSYWETILFHNLRYIRWDSSLARRAVPFDCKCRIHLQCRRRRRLSFYLWVGKIPWRGAWPLTSVSLPGESPWTEEPGGLQSTGSHRVRHDWSSLARHSSPHLAKCPAWKDLPNLILLSVPADPSDSVSWTAGDLCVDSGKLVGFLWNLTQRWEGIHCWNLFSIS